MTMTTGSVFDPSKSPNFQKYAALLTEYNQAKAQNASSEVLNKLKEQLDRQYMSLTQNEVNAINKKFTT
jgi:NAD-dependent SIR2 family protein deacetylase